MSSLFWKVSEKLFEKGIWSVHFITFNQMELQEGNLNLGGAEAPPLHPNPYPYLGMNLQMC